MNSLFDDLTIKIKGEEYIFSPVDIKVFNYNTYEQSFFVTYKFDIDAVNAKEQAEIKEALLIKYGNLNFSIPNDKNIVTITRSN